MMRQVYKYYKLESIFVKLLNTKYKIHLDDVGLSFV